MAIINCPECLKEVSANAKMCPNCGFPLKKKGKGFAIASLLLGILSLFYTFTFCIHNILVATFSKYNLLQEKAIWFAFVLIIFVSLAAIICSIVAHKKEIQFKYTKMGMIMGIISIVVSVIIKILF